MGLERNRTATSLPVMAKEQYAVEQEKFSITINGIWNRIGCRFVSYRLLRTRKLCGKSPSAEAQYHPTTQKTVQGTQNVEASNKQAIFS